MNKEDIKNKVYNSCPEDHRCEKECALWSLMVPIEEGMKIISCPCAEKIERYYKYADAGIEPEFWEFNIDKVDKEFDWKIIDEYVKVFMNKTEAWIQNKVWLWFYGHSGSGTTSTAILMLKHAIDSGYKGKLVSASEIINILYSNNRDIAELSEYDFLVIDAVDRLREDRIGQIKDFSATATDLMDKRSVVFTASIHSADLSKNYCVDFRNRVQNIPNVSFKDINFREKFASKFESLRRNL